VQDSLRDSRAGKRAAAAPDARAEAKRRRKAAHDSDSDDDYFDRTKPQQKRKEDAKAAAAAHTVETLCARRAEQRADAARLEALIAEVSMTRQALDNLLQHMCARCCGDAGHTIKKHVRSVVVHCVQRATIASVCRFVRRAQQQALRRQERHWTR
jgi:hypothetical protein